MGKVKTIQVPNYGAKSNSLRKVPAYSNEEAKASYADTSSKYIQDRIMTLQDTLNTQYSDRWRRPRKGGRNPEGGQSL